MTEVIEKPKRAMHYQLTLDDVYPFVEERILDWVNGRPVKRLVRGSRKRRGVPRPLHKLRIAKREDTPEKFLEEHKSFYEGLTEDQVARVLPTMVVLGLVDLPAKIIEKVDIPSKLVEEEVELKGEILERIEAEMESGRSVNDIYLQMAAEGLLEKRGEGNISYSLFAKWSRVARMKSAREAKAGLDRMSTELKADIQMMVQAKISSRKIYVILQKEGRLNRSEGQPPFGYIAVRDRVGIARKKLGFRPVKGEHVLYLHQQGKTEEEICKQLGIDHRGYYSHAVRQGIIVPKSKEELMNGKK